MGPYNYGMSKSIFPPLTAPNNNLRQATDATRKQVRLFVSNSCEDLGKKESRPSAAVPSNLRFVCLGTFDCMESAVQQAVSAKEIALAFIVPGACLAPKIPAKHKDDETTFETARENHE